MRRAISPRLAIRIFSNMVFTEVFRYLCCWNGSRARAYFPPIPVTLADHHQGFAVLDGLTVLDHEPLDHAVLVGLHLVHQLHRFAHADGLSLLDRISDLAGGFRPAWTRAVESANTRR